MEIRDWKWLVVGLYGLLAVSYGIINPIFEAPDEHHHYFTARHIVVHSELPVASSDSLARQEAAQPPLYYLLAAGLIAPLELEISPMSLWANPYIQFETRQTRQNINAFVHTAVERWPWQGDVLAVHILRVYSTLLGLGTLWFIYQSAMLLWPKRPQLALLSLALVAFLPQFLFAHSAVSNDSLIILLSTAVLWQLLWLWQNELSWRRLGGLGVTIGLAVLAKMTGLLLLPFAWGVIFCLLWRDGRLRQFLPICGWLSLIILLISGWLLWRNWLLYGDVTAVNQFIELTGGLRPYTLRQVWHDMARVWRSLIAYWGWMTVQAPMWVYAMWIGFAALALGGWFYALYVGHPKFRRGQNLLQQSWFPLVWLGGWWLVVVLAWLQFMLQTPADQGRLWFPAILPMILVLAHGVGQWSRRWLETAVIVLALATSVQGAWTIWRAYAPPTRMQVADIPPSAIQLNADLGKGMTLIAAEIAPQIVTPSEVVHLILYWQANITPTTAPIVQIEALGRESQSVGFLQTYHGRGLYPANLWEDEQQIVSEHVAFDFSPLMRTPTQVRLMVHLRDGEGRAEIGRIKVRLEHEEPLMPLAQIGPEIALIQAEADMLEVQPGETVSIALAWFAQAKQEQALTAFVHLGDPNQAPLAQMDAPPLAQDYPPSMWKVGDLISDTFTLVVPLDMEDGRYPLHTGLYNSTTLARLPLHIDGNHQPSNSYLLGWLIVERK